MSRPGWYWWLALLASCLTTGALAVAIALRSQAESERKFCTIVVTQDDAWSETTPTSVTGRRVADAMADLRRELGCSVQ